MDDRNSGMTLIVKTVTKLTLAFILLYGIYIALSGHSSPGGGFAGGVIVALSFVHIMLAFGKKIALKRMHSYVLRFLVSAGALVFLYTVVGRNSAVCGLFNREAVASLAEMAIVGFGLFAIFIALVLLSKSDKDAE